MIEKHPIFGRSRRWIQDQGYIGRGFNWNTWLLKRSLPCFGCCAKKWLLELSSTRMERSTEGGSWTSTFTKRVEGLAISSKVVSFLTYSSSGQKIIDYSKRPENIDPRHTHTHNAWHILPWYIPHIPQSPFVCGITLARKFTRAKNTFSIVGHADTLSY